MRVRCLLPVAAASLLLAALPSEARQAVTFTDVAGDANGSATVEDVESASPANQAYADIVSVRWESLTTRTGGKVVATGFRVVATLSAAPTPPTGVEVVYRASARVDKGTSGRQVGPVFYTTPLRDGTVPQTALRDTLTGVARFTKLPPAKVSGSTITWTVPFSALPPGVRQGDVLHELAFESRLSEDFRGASTPPGLPVFPSMNGATAGVLDEVTSDRAFTLS